MSSLGGGCHRLFRQRRGLSSSYPSSSVFVRITRSSSSSSVSGLLLSQNFVSSPFETSRPTNNKNNNNNPRTSFFFVCGTRQQQHKQQQQSRTFSTNIYEGKRSSKANATTKTTTATFEDTPLGKHGLHLLDGLDRYTVPSAEDGHPLSIYGIHSQDPISYQNSSSSSSSSSQSLYPILLLHGRTWSSVPVYHLLGGPRNASKGIESRSLLEALYAKGLQPYAMDFRGFGGTPPDETGCVEPARCVQDAETALEWIAQRHGIHECNNNNNKNNNNNTVVEAPALMGWSQGAMVAQLLAQKLHTPYLSKLILYASIHDSRFRYARDPLYRMQDPNEQAHNNNNNNNMTQPQNNDATPPLIKNTFNDAIEDFTIEGTIPPEPAMHFAQAALTTDPIKAVWKHTYQFNNCDPARVHVPCLVVAGDQDPYAPLHVQQELFCNLGRESDRTWSILSGSDHAVHLLDGRFRLINAMASFITNEKRSEQNRHE